MSRLGIMTGVLAAALCAQGLTAAEVAPGCSDFAVVATPDGGAGTDLRSVDALDASSVWAVGHRFDPTGTEDGYPLAMRWDGSRFVVEPIPDLSHLGLAPTLESVGIAPTGDPWVVGGFRDTFTGVNMPLILRWSGGFWQTYPVTQLNSFVARYARLRDVAAVSEQDAWTIGEARIQADGAIEPFAAHWDGTAWSEVAMPGTTDNRVLTAITARPAAVWAVGYDIVAGPTSARNTSYARIYRWDGAAWAVIDNPVAMKPGSALQDVVALAENDVWAVGSAGTEGLFLHWDGSVWTSYPAPPNADPRSVDGVATNDVWAADSKGNYRWDGTSWTFFPTTNGTSKGALRAIAVGGACDVWVIASTNTGATSSSRIERVGLAAPPPAVPAMPIAFVATPKSPKDIVLAWLPGESDPTGPVGQTAFLIARCLGTAAGCRTPFEDVLKVGGTVTTVVDSGLAPNTSYVYKICAVNGAGESLDAGPVAARTLPDSRSPLPDPKANGGSAALGMRHVTIPMPPEGPPPSPSRLALKASSRRIGLSWVPGNDPGPSGLYTFVIERCLGASPADCVKPFVIIRKLASDVTSYVDTGLQPATAHTYRIYAVNEAGASAPTVPVTTSTLSDPSSPLPVPSLGTSQSDPYTSDVLASPLPPQGPSAAPAMPVAFKAKGVSQKEIVLDWVPGGAPNGSVGQEAFVIERCASDVGGACAARFAILAKVGGKVTSFVDSGLQPARAYTYRVYAINATGKSEPTAPESAATFPAESTSVLPRS